MPAPRPSPHPVASRPHQTSGAALATLLASLFSESALRDLADHQIFILAGGCDDEEAVSWVSGLEMHGALGRLGIESTLLDYADGEARLVGRVCSSGRPALVFNALHGGAGEDGTVRRMLDAHRIPSTHSSADASRIAMDKLATRNLLAENGIAVPKAMMLDQCPLGRHPFGDQPYVMKPVSGGSSVGVRFVDPASMPAFHPTSDGGPAASADPLYAGQVLVERYVGTRELTVGLLDGHPLEVTEIHFGGPIYDYQAKYAPQGSRHVCPALIAGDIRVKALDLAAHIWTLLGCSGAARIDFRFDELYRELFVLEANTQPGLTLTSLLPEQALRHGLSLGHLGIALLGIALRDSRAHNAAAA